MRFRSDRDRGYSACNGSTCGAGDRGPQQGVCGRACRASRSCSPVLQTLHRCRGSLALPRRNTRHPDGHSNTAGLAVSPVADPHVQAAPTVEQNPLNRLAGQRGFLYL